MTLLRRLRVINHLISNDSNFMKALLSDYYTDPIVYKEGFFKNPQEEQAYMARIAEQTAQVKAGSPKKSKAKSVHSRRSPK